MDLGARSTIFYSKGVQLSSWSQLLVSSRCSCSQVPQNIHRTVIDLCTLMSFFPRSDATYWQNKVRPPVSRPTAIAPILDSKNALRPVIPWTVAFQNANYPERSDGYSAAPVPPEPVNSADDYLHPALARSERMRLTMLWYCARDILQDEDLLSRLQEKVDTAQKVVNWAEFAIIGLLDHNSYTRLATHGLPLAILPRRESTCAHTINQTPRVCVRSSMNASFATDSR